MPLKKRVLYDPAAYHRKDVFEESTPDSFLPDHNMSKLLGTMNQLAYLSSFALEIFQNLAVLSEDLSERIKLSSVRTTVLFDSLRAVDREVSSIDDDSHIAAVSGLSAYLQSREMITPQLFNKSTNYNSITAQYRICRPPPQLWRIEVFTHEDCFRNYSNPGFFFQEWIRTEIIRQQLKKEEKKKNKVLRKQQRQERKKLKEEAEAAAAEDDDLLFPLQPFGLIENQSNDGRNSSNVSLSGVTDKGKRSKSILSPNREDFKKKMQAESNDRNATRRASPPRDQLHQQQQQQPQQRERDYSFDQAEQNQSDAEEGSVRMGGRGQQNSNNNTAVIDTVKEKQKKKGLKGLSKLFKRSKKDKEHKTGGDSDELSESEEEIYQTQQNAHINGGGERERGLSRDLLRSDSDDAVHYPRKLSQSPPISQTHPYHAPAQPKSYVEELTAAATTTTRRMSVSSMYPLGAMAEYANEDDNNLYDEVPRMQMQPIPNNRHTAKRRKQAPVTMKIGSKFLSASSGGNSKAEKTVTDTVPDLSAQVDERKKDAQSRQSKARTLLRQPSSTPLQTTHSTHTTQATPNKKANKRQSFALPAQSTPGMFNDRRHPQKSFASVTAGGMNGSVKSSDDEDSAGDMLAGSSLRRRSLLTMLQDEVFEELHREQEEIERESDFPEPEEEEEEEENYDEYGNPIPIGSRNSAKSLDMLEDDVDPADEEEGTGGVDITEDDVFAGENDGDDDFIDEQDAPDSDQEPSEPESSEDEGQDQGREEELPSDEETENRGSSERSVRSDSDGEGGRRDRKKVHSRPPPPPPPTAAGRPGPPPPPPAPVPTPAPPRSALSSSVLGSLQSAARESLRKVAPPPEPKVDDRAHLLRSIQLGSSQLKGAPSKAAAPFQKIAVQQNEAVAAILANRSKIAGSDTESSDDSDSDYTDDDY